MPPKTVAEERANFEIFVNNRSENEKFKYPTNYISTTKYTAINFLPKNLFLQFHKASNCFFLVNMIIALIPGVSPVFPATTIIPLVVVLSVAAGRDAYEDFGRYQSDRRANSSPVEIIMGGATTAITTKPSAEILAGDVLYLRRGAEIPADCVVISSAMEDGACFVETANLDGETNLKPKQAKLGLQNKFNTVASISGLSGKMTCEAPSQSLSGWIGRIMVPGCGELALEFSHLLLRGCSIRNVDWVIAVVAYTGVNTKLFLNLKQTPPKISRLDIKLNRLIAIILSMQQVLILTICTLCAVWSTDSSHENAFYLNKVLTQYSGGVWFVLAYLTYFVLLAFMMPISLFVSLEFCKTAQAKFMDWDEKMENDGRPMAARTSSLNEELSQVQYVFSDKTGTLTENQMRFARAFAGGVDFDELKTPGAMAKYMQSNPEQRKMGTSTVWNFLRLLSVNNAVIINLDAAGHATYDGSSTDEVALVGTARDNGFKLTGRTSETMTVEIERQPTVFQVLDFLPFTPERKMMSVVVKEANGDLRLYTKGADSSVIARLADHTSDPERAKMLATAQKFLDSCSEEGLRTLVCAEKFFTPSEYASWKKTWDSANLYVGPDRGDRMHTAALEAESNLLFVGCTAIEDRLQDEVPETIHFMLRCGILVWVLTGDKRETALTISKTSKLLNPTTDHVMQIYATGVPLSTQLDNYVREARDARERGQKCSFIVDGASLEKIWPDPKLKDAFRVLGLIVNSAVCCRVTPIQKANIVTMFQEMGHTCLGVGDGANDVSMIQEARVGIGIMGLEGSQAERAADYALPKFRFLRRLLAVHGRYSLIRNSNLVQYSFYKNLVYSMVQVYYGFYNGYSGQTLFDSWVLTFFNMAFTFLPPMVMGMFDFDVRDAFLMQHPGLYSELRSPFAMRMSRVSSFLWLLMAFWHSWLIYFGTYNSNMRLTSQGSGRDSGLWFDGTTMCTTLLLVVNAQAALSFLSWTVIHAASIVLSFVAYFGFIFLYAAVPPNITGNGSYFGVPAQVFADGSADLSYFVWFALLMTPQFIIMAARRNFFGTRMHYARAADYNSKRKLPWVTSSANMNASMEMRLIDSPQPHTRQVDDPHEVAQLDRVL